MTHTFLTKDFRRQKSVDSGESVSEVPFFFNFLPSGYTDCQTFCCSEEHCRQPLPPSFTAKPSYPLTWKENSVSSLGLRKCEIKYSVTARLWNDGEVVAEVSRPWTYTPRSHVPPPPISVSDFPKEYRLSAKEFATDLIKLKVYGEISAKVEQARPILVRDPAAEEAIALSVPVKLRAECTQRPDITKCDCEFSLETNKLFSIKCQGAKIPQLHDMPLTVGAERVKSRQQTYTSSDISWHRAVGRSLFNTMKCPLMLKLSVTDKNGLHWAALVDTTFYLQQKFPLPTFSAGFVSLRHTLVMKLKLVNQRGRVVTHALSLRNPLQIAHASSAPKAPFERTHDTPEVDYFDDAEDLFVSEFITLFTFTWS